MHLRQGTTVVLVCVAAWLASHPALAEADRYDAPVVSVAGTSRTSVTLAVRAGSTGAPAGFVIEYARSSDLAAAGSWGDAVTLGFVTSAQFVGTPTFNTTETAPTFRLSPYATHPAEVGDLFDETGVVSSSYTLELDPSTEYQFRAYALGDANGQQSVESSLLAASTLTTSQNCTYTQGYWKNHFGQWPVTSLKLGNVTYTASQLLSILDTPAQGNGLLLLAHQLIAAKLSIAQGADPTPVSSVIADADALIGSLVCPPVGSGYLDPTLADTDAQALDSYNNGNTFVPHCGATPTRASTWGAVKTLYR